MNVFFGSKLACIVVSPNKNTIVVIDDIYESAPHINLFYALWKLGFDSWSFQTAFQKWRPLLKSSNDKGEEFISV